MILENISQHFIKYGDKSRHYKVHMYILLVLFIKYIYIYIYSLSYAFYYYINTKDPSSKLTTSLIFFMKEKNSV